VAVPGELKGYWEVYKRFGSLSWERLIAPTIKICEEGLLVNSGLASVIQQKAEDILESESLR
jgi:gamma-glutamyltranspeptidase